MINSYDDPLGHDYLNFVIKDFHHTQIIKNIFSRFCLLPEMLALEIGAGTGRYTDLLLSQGVRVIATEPDPTFVKILQEKYRNNKKVTVVFADISNIKNLSSGVDIICGFHVMHHLNHSALQDFSGNIKDLLNNKTNHLKGWFFLEPNPLNPMYPIQITLHPAMKWKDEIGIWKANLHPLEFSSEDIHLGTIGLFPPRNFTDKTPIWLQKLGTDFRWRYFPFMAYSMYGEIFNDG
jgi:SAM-dependent methyltransferase